MTIDQLERALMLRDLTDPAAGSHAVQLVVEAIEHALVDRWSVAVWRDPGPRVVSAADNYDRLRYSRDAITRDHRYTRYVGGGQMLRSHTTARIPTLLDRLATTDPKTADACDVLLSVPGLCYRRDVIDRNHVGEPHQMDLWRVRRAGPSLSEQDLEAMVGIVVSAVVPGARWHTVPNAHPYTLAGREIYAEVHGQLIEVGECGLAHPEVLASAGLAADSTGLAMGLGLDRLTMLAKGIDDIRLLRSTDPRVAAQMGDLAPYRPASAMPPIRRDLSIAVDAELDAELLGDRIRSSLGPQADAVEEVTILAETPYRDLPSSAQTRMGLREGQKNVLVRIVLRALDHTLTTAEANGIRDRIYTGIHEGSALELTGADHIRRPASPRS